MTRSSSAGADSVGRFLRNQRFRHQETRRIYGHILRAFQSSVGECSTGASVSVSNLQEWLREKRQKWPLHMVCHRARLVERFLEWSQALGVIYTNPFAELHRHYGPRTTPIVRALVSDDSRGGITGPTPCAAVWKLPRKGDGRARGADALARLSLRRQRRYAAALRSLPAEPCRIGRQAIESAYRSVGSKRSLAKPSV